MRLLEEARFLTSQRGKSAGKLELYKVCRKGIGEPVLSDPDC